ncbi:MAG: FAD-binding protein [Alphaproteobacteria bacterium]|nr:FAD-binding protein [Alphaproteobacteria bacterium]
MISYPAEGANVSQQPPDHRVSHNAVADALRALHKIFPDRVETDPAVCATHANTRTWIAAEPPDAVVQPQCTDDVVQIVRMAEKFKVPLIAFGGGTSLEGHVNAPLGGLSIDFSRMNRIVEINSRDLTARVEAGVTLAEFNAALQDCDVFFSVDPGAGTATLGGMAATRASGTNTVRYGTMRDNVMSLQAVMADSSVVETATAARKSSAGYDLTHLLVGSEGTLGLITALTVRLHPVPPASVVLVCGFPTVHDACEAVIDVLQSGVRPARIELLDAKMVGAVNLHSGTSVVEVPTLFVEFHGTSAEADAQKNRFLIAAEKHGLQETSEASEPARQNTLWQARHAAFDALKTAWPDKTVLATDVCVPLSQLSKCIEQAQRDIDRLGLTAPIVGHVGDGNFHVLPVFEISDADQRAAVDALLTCLVETALDLGGTCSGEHGIGQGKIAFLEREAGAGIAVMGKIKHALDPLYILNPGKVIRF